MGFDYIKGWIQLQALKIGLPGIGGYLQVPIIFSLVYSFGKIISYKFYCDVNGIEFVKQDILTIFQIKKDYGKKFAKKNKDKLIKLGKEGKDNLFLGINKLKLSLPFNDFSSFISYLKNLNKKKPN